MHKLFISVLWTERSGYVAALKSLEIMEKVKSWKIISEKGKILKSKLRKIAQENKLKINISGLDSCPSYNLKFSNWMKYKTFITQELLNKKILGANTTYVSIAHTNKILSKYIEVLSKIFHKINQSEKSNIDINSLLKGPVCHSGFKRLN